MLLDESRKKTDEALGSEPYKRVKNSPEISSARALIRLEGFTPSPLESSMKAQSNNQREEPTKKINTQEPLSSKEKERTPVDYNENRFKQENKHENKYENKHNDRYDAQVSHKSIRKAADFSQKPSTHQHQTYQTSNQSSRPQNLPPELKSDRVYSALIRSTPHIKFNGSHYDNHIILVLPSSLFGK